MKTNSVRKYVKRQLQERFGLSSQEAAKIAGDWLAPRIDRQTTMRRPMVGNNANQRRSF